MIGAGCNIRIKEVHMRRNDTLIHLINIELIKLAKID